ncbi:MAG: NAD(P)/FAD-dependent oxidoreductase [Bacteroidetes bacterium]|nr:NAD(P)/FAD-dependent oxidoreductase [Bacteroidota bacterium]
MKIFDLFIIGTGVAGTAIANKCVEAGLSVGITDNQVYGGTCALRGCVPKKVLVDATKVVDMATRFKGQVNTSAQEVDWKKLIAFKQSFVDSFPEKKEKNFIEKGITTFHGTAKFIDKNKLQVGDQKLQAKKIVVATGATTRKLDILGSNYALSSTEFLNLEALPSSMLFIGGGYIAFEFAHVVARCGVKVTMIDMAASPLGKFEQDIVKYEVEATKNLGVNIVLNTQVTKIQKEGDRYKVTGQHDGKDTTYDADMVVNASGRVPAIQSLELDKAGIKYSKNGIEVNKYLQSVSNSLVYAAGDVSATQGLPLTPLATMEAYAVVDNIINGNSKQPDYTAMPTVVYTQPPLAAVGLNEKQAKDKKLEYTVNYKDASGWYNARRLNASVYAFKIIIEKGTGKILGAHIIGPCAEETINLFSMAIKAGLTPTDIKQLLISFPSMGSDIKFMV